MRNRIAVFVVLLLSGCESYSDRLRPYERAYFEGQRDALSGDVRIKYDNDSKCWRWTKTCWDNGQPTTFDPSSSK